MHLNECHSLLPPTQRTYSKTVHPRQALEPLKSPPVQLDNYPALPSPARDPAFTSGYTVSTHVFPAAFPRCPSSQWVPPPEQESKDEKRKRIAKTVATYAALKERQERNQDTRLPHREVLWTVANRYVRNARSVTTPGLTLVFLHCIGSHKEVSLAVTTLCTPQAVTDISADVGPCH
jgi:hypothetical protein